MNGKHIVLLYIYTNSFRMQETLSSEQNCMVRVYEHFIYNNNCTVNLTIVCMVDITTL